MPSIAIIVLTYNRSDALLVVLRALAMQCTSSEEVIVADDGSNAAHVARIRSECPSFRCKVSHIWHPDIGFTASRARNLGALASTSEYLIFLDGDCVPPPEFIAMHRQLMQRGVFVNGSRVLLSQALTDQVLKGDVLLETKTTFDWFRYCLQGLANKWLWPLGATLNRFGLLERLRTKRAFEWKGIRSCNLGVWRDDFYAVNGFDETFSGWGHEDADLVLRLHHLGLIRKNGFWATEVWHLHHPDNTRANEQRNKQSVLNRIAAPIVQAQVGLSHITSTDLPESIFL